MPLNAFSHFSAVNELSYKLPFWADYYRCMEQSWPTTEFLNHQSCAFCTNVSC